MSSPLPVTPGASPSDTAPPSAPPSSGAGRVLVVDDEHAILRWVARALEPLGYELTTAERGDEALEVLSKRRFDAIVTDIHMPGLDGLGLLRVARTHDLDVPVILMTAAPTLETAISAVQHGAVRYLVKPFAADLLRAEVGRCVRLSRLGRLKRQALAAVGEDASGPGDLAGLLDSWIRLMEDRLWLAAQPIVATATGHTEAYEILLRSREPTLPHPGAVLRAAERLDRTEELGRQVRALSARLFDSAPPEALLFVNLHARDLADPELSDPSSPLARNAERVVLEVTERATLDGVSDLAARIRTLRSLGYRLAVDDLGAGYAGLTAFAALEPELVKLDMSLIRGIDASPVRQKVVRSMTKLCHEMGIRVVAEGIETKAELDIVVSHGCDLLQGYLLAKPGPPFPPATWPTPG